MENDIKYSIFEAVAQATPVSKCVFAILLFMSVFSWACIGKKWRTLHASFQHNQQAIKQFDLAEKQEDALMLLQRDGKTALGYIAAMGVHE